MGGVLETATRQLFEALDRKDAGAVKRTAAKDIQGVDEISRRWNRGIEAYDSYFQQLLRMVDHSQSTINDVHETTLGDAGLVTCWLEQDYTLEGKRTHVSAPTSVAFRRERDGWKIILIHTVPMPPAEA
jgi:ketosteroid isomerase-like protein